MERLRWHKYRVRVRGATTAEAREKLADEGVLTSLWESEPLPENKEVYPQANQLCQESFILGNEQYPMAIQSDDVVKQWALGFKSADTKLQGV
mgnify:CR=1 FL=1